MLRWAGHSGRAREWTAGRATLRVRTGAGDRWYFRGRSADGRPGFGGVAPLGPGIIWGVYLRGEWPRAWGRALVHELRCGECRVSWRSWWRRLIGDPRGYSPAVHG